MITRRGKTLKEPNIFIEDSQLKPSSTNNSAVKYINLKSAHKLMTPEFSFERIDVSRIKLKTRELISTNDGVQPSHKRGNSNDSDIKLTTKDSWLRLLDDCGPQFASNLRGNSSIRRTTMAIGERNNKQITSFDDLSIIKVEHVEENDAPTLLGKRGRGRPTKEVSKQIALDLKKKEAKVAESIHDGYIYNKEDPLGFISDAEDIELNLEYEDLDESKTVLAFGNNCFSAGEPELPRGKMSNCLDFHRFLQVMNNCNDRDRKRQFVCRFCGKTFEKPSSLGGHTAKTHNGLSFKYRNRVNASISRQAERKRLQFLKIEVPKALGMAPPAQKP